MNRKHDFTKAARIQQRNARIFVKEENGFTDEPFAPPGGETPGLQELPCKSRFKDAGGGPFRSGYCEQVPAPIAFEHALCIQSAEFWLRLGEPLEALAEIEDLPQSLRRLPRVHKLHAYAIEAARTFQAKSVCT